MNTYIHANIYAYIRKYGLIHISFIYSFIYVYFFLSKFSQMLKQHRGRKIHKQEFSYINTIKNVKRKVGNTEKRKKIKMERNVLIPMCADNTGRPSRYGNETGSVVR